MSALRLLLCVALFGAVIEVSAWTFDISHVDVSEGSLGILPGKYVPELGLHSIFKRKVIKGFLKNQLLDYSAGGVQRGDWTLMEGFTGAGLHHRRKAQPNDPEREKGSAIAVIEAALTLKGGNAPTAKKVPQFWFNDGDENVKNHLRAAINKIAAQAKPRIGKTFDLTGRITYNHAKFHDALPMGMAANLGRHLWLHVDPYEYSHAPFDSLVSFFANPGGKIRALNMNIFPRKMLADLIWANEQKTEKGLQHLSDKHIGSKSLPLAGFGFREKSAGKDFLTALYTKYDQLYHSGGVDAARDAIETALTQSASGLHHTNKVSRALVMLWLDRLVSEVARLHTGVPAVHACAKPVALIDDGSPMYWLTFLSNKDDLTARWDATIIKSYHNEGHTIKAMADTGALYFDGENKVPPTGFLESKAQVSSRARRLRERLSRESDD